MKPDLPVSDEQLMAYADGELDDEQAALVETAMAEDWNVAQRVAQHQAMRAQLQNSFTSVLSEPVPARLLEVLQPGNTSTTQNISSLKQARQRRYSTRHWAIPEWSAMAASLVIGIVIGAVSLSMKPTALIATHQGGLVAQGKLATALSTQLASAPTPSEDVQLGISYRNRAGNYCRSFTLSSSEAMAGVACHEQGQWRMQIVTMPEAVSGEFRQASSATPAAVLALIEEQRVGEPLDSDAERAARKKGWQ